MRLVKAMWLLLIAVTFNTVQSMEEGPHYPLETQLFDGVISVRTYFFKLEEALKGTAESAYAWMLKALRTALYRGDDLYIQLMVSFAHTLSEGRASFAHLSEQDIAQTWGEHMTKDMVKKDMVRQMHEDVLHNVGIEHNNLNNLIAQGLARRLPDASESGG